MRVMFVDDEPQVLKGIMRMLDSAEVDWDVETATSGAAALECMEEQPVAVLVSDMQMPGMDGAELLEQVSQLYPETVRIILSGQADKEAVFRAVSPMHQYLSKPCGADTLRDTISRACALRNLLDSTKSHEFLGNVSSLPSLPDLYQQLVAEIESEQGTLARVGEIIGQDPAMAVKVLQLANSAIFGLRSKVTSPSQAASIIGLEALKPLVLSLQVFKSFDQTTVPGFSIESFTTHCLRVGSIARRIAQCETFSTEATSESFTAGLLHDVGKLILATHAPDDYARAIAESKSQSVPSAEAEREVLGLGHDGIGGYLLALWGLPQSIVEAVAFHHQPEQCVGVQLTTSAVVYFANAMAHEKSDAALKEELVACGETLENMGLMDRLDVWRSAVSEVED